MAKKYTYEEVKKIVVDFGYELVSKDYKNAMTKLSIKDKSGYYFIISLNNLINIKSIPRPFDKKNLFSIQNIKRWIKINNKPFELLSDVYKGSKNKLQWKCLKDNCGEIFESTWSVILGNCGCPYCAGLCVGLTNCLATKNPELAKEWHPNKNGNLTPYDVTCGSGKVVWWKCSKNPKHEWENRVVDRKKGYGCPYCSGRLPTETNNLLINNPKLCEEWDYSKNNTKPEEYTPKSSKKVWWICKDCEYNWVAQIYSRNNGRDCPRCNNSRVEKKIKEILLNYNIPHDSEFTFDNLKGVGKGLLRFDVSVFDNIEKTKIRTLIEFDGVQHFRWIKGMMTKNEFEILKTHDRLKEKYCKINHIPILRIKYNQFDNIEEILIKELNLIENKLAI